MKKIKKLISLVSAAAIIATSILSNTVFADFTDVSSDNQYSKSITTLSTLGVINGYDDGTFKPDGSITRAEFAKIITYVLGLSGLTTPSTEFSDVGGHWANANIKTAYDQGIINGFEDGTFRPDDNVTYEQALKMIVCTLGYDAFAQAAGGYPVGYQSQAASLGLTKGISGLAFDAPANRGAIAQAVYNALEVSMQQKDNSGQWVSSDKTLLNDYLNVKKFKGELAGVEEHVTGNCVGTLLKGQMQMVSTSSSGTYVTMDYTAFTQNITDISKYLGKMITVYYRQKNDNDEAVLVAIDSDTTKNTEINVVSDNIIGLESTSFKYYDNNASKNAKVDMDNVTVRYNGKTVDRTGTQLRTKEDKLTDKTYSFKDALNNWLDPDSDFFIYGDVILTDRESDGTIDDIQINDYKTMLALKSPTTSDYKITDKLKTGNSLVLNPNSTEYTYTVVKDGKEAALTSIAANDVITYVKSIDGSIYTLYVTSKKITGTVSSYSSADGTITIDKQDYNVDPECEGYISTKQNGKKLSSGQTGTFYIDKFDTVIYAEIAEEKEKPYAYITNVYEGDGTEQWYISAYCPAKSTSSTVSYPLKNKVTVGTQGSVNQEAVADILEEIAKNSNADVADETIIKNIYGSDLNYDANTYKYSQLARIDINTQGYVTSIIPVSDKIGDTNSNESEVIKCKELAKYKYNSGTFSNGNSKFSVNSSSVILYVPGDRSKSGFAKKSSSSFEQNSSYYVEAYDLNNSNVANLVIYYGKSGKITEVTRSTAFSIITNRPEEFYNSDKDETTLQLTVFPSSGDAEKKWTVAEADEFADCEIGDVIQFGYDQDNYATQRANCVLFRDIKSELDKKTYDWTDEDKFDYRFKNETTSQEAYGTVYRSRAAMYNVVQVLDDDTKLYVTKNGFDSEGKLIDENSYDEIHMNSSTKFIRMKSDRKGFSKYVEDTEAALTYLDLKDVKNYGSDCSKILVLSKDGLARMIVIYE